MSSRTSIFIGLFATLAMLGIYFLVLTLIYEWDYAWQQFALYWSYIVGLALGFGIQIGLYARLRLSMKEMIETKERGGTSVVAITGTTSTSAMLSCCAHYLVNILPVLGATGLATFIGQYQIELFWVALAINLLGILFMLNKVLKHEYHAMA